ncbi:MAG TPA: beta-N-acetylhexosaminidase [Verrucomicrobiae bacterium]|nr:beta-N-acetylhexosaminidase [Verrucomicrobiae bacterium]
MKKILCATFVAATCTLLHAAGIVSLIPQPQTVSNMPGEFELQAKTKITFAGGEAEAKLLATTLRKSTGYKLPVSSAATLPAKSEISFLLDTNLAEALGPEGYKLSVTFTRVGITAATPAGLFYGSQTLLQLLPPEIFSANKMRRVFWRAQCVEITDSPRFIWRGFMLDVSRHFYTVPEVEHVLDLMAMYKLNTFHWHLTDDQGWRIEIKKYPKLTSVGAWRKGVGFKLDPKSTTAYGPDGRYGGFYTQKQVRDVIAYAAARHITIVPEIEMPGHSMAALAAYPQFSCTGGPYTTDHDGGVYDGIYNVSDDATYVFLGDIVHEVAGLFPGKFIHIGGDEVPKKVWQNSAACQALMKAKGLKDEKELQSYFTARIEAIVNTNGKSIIGWSEIREGGLTPSAGLMDWIGGGAESAASGHDVVMSPTKYGYFDHYQSTNHTSEPKAIGGFLPLKQVYEFDPMPEKLAPENRAHVLGGQANLWTEYIPNIRYVEYMILPRLSALAEVDWSSKESRDWASFQNRTAVNEKRLDVMGVNYRPLSKNE